MTADAISSIILDVIEPVQQTRWCVLTVRTNEGTTGYGEATMMKLEAEILSRATAMLPGLIGQRARPGLVRPLLATDDLAAAAVLSALSQALWDIKARSAGVCVAEAAGGISNRHVPLYANINRRTRGRTSEAFAESAGAALAAGFRAIKLAPFDEVTPQAHQEGRVLAALDAGMARVAAVRESVGPHIDLMVDCHWRLSPEAARTVLAELRPLALYWLECPLPENEQTLPELKSLRAAANSNGVRLAGCETQFGLGGFEPFIAAGAYDVMMPDVKYVGSIEEMLRLAERLERSGVEFSPHNPSGPIAHAASLQVCALAPSLTRLEMQFDETPLFWSLVGGALPMPIDGASALPDRPGLGVDLAPDVLELWRSNRLAF